MNKEEIFFLMDNAKNDFGVLKKWTNTKRMSPDEVYENVKNLVAAHIVKMIEGDYGKLLEILYQTDIDEKKVKNCFHIDKTTREVAHCIADLYIQRLIEKWKTRRLFSRDDIVGDWD